MHNIDVECDVSELAELLVSLLGQVELTMLRVEMLESVPHIALKRIEQLVVGLEVIRVKQVSDAPSLPILFVEIVVFSCQNSGQAAI